MSRNRILFITAALCLSVIAAGCSTAVTTPSLAKILPDECIVQSGQRIALALDGVIPPNAIIQWEVSDGSIAFTPPGLNAYFSAPTTPTIVTISVSISSGTPGVSAPITRQCIVQADGSGPQPTLPTSGGNVLPQPLPSNVTVVISEVMAFPCGSVDFKKWNQYVELYNAGDQPVDVRGLWLHDGGGTGTPDQIVAWQERAPHTSPGANTIVDTTVIPPHGFAVVLSPIYAQGEPPYHMPYQFPPNTIILTIAGSDSLGDDYFNIVGDGEGRDPVILYAGSASVVDHILSTYGSPSTSTYVVEFRDDRQDNLPLDLHACGSAERVSPFGADVFDNWHEVPGGSPGDAPY
ncbi:MAG: hypothetical protein ACOY0R_14395 [Chloroflexota bacterium]